MEFQCFEVKPEDDKPSTGMFAGSAVYCICFHVAIFLSLDQIYIESLLLLVSCVTITS